MGCIPDAWERRQRELGPRPTIFLDMYRQVAASTPTPSSLTHQELLLWVAEVWRRLRWDVRSYLTGRL